jgi:hypothetical protein
VSVRQSKFIAGLIDAFAGSQDYTYELDWGVWSLHCRARFCINPPS